MVTKTVQPVDDNMQAVNNLEDAPDANSMETEQTDGNANMPTLELESIPLPSASPSIPSPKLVLVIGTRVPTRSRKCCRHRNTNIRCRKADELDRIKASNRRLKIVVRILEYILEKLEEENRIIEENLVN